MQVTKSYLKKLIKECLNEQTSIIKEAKMSVEDAYESAKKEGIKFTGDYHKDCDVSQGNFLAELAKKVGYKKPQNANGSTGRYFYSYLMKANKK